MVGDFMKLAFYIVLNNIIVWLSMVVLGGGLICSLDLSGDVLHYACFPQPCQL